MQVVAAIADVLGRTPPGPELSVVDATVADIAALLASQPVASAREPAGRPSGLADWIHAFEHRWTPVEPSGTARL